MEMKWISLTSAHGRSVTSSPILDMQSADLLELADIGSNHHQTTCQPRSSYQDIVSADGLSLSLERRANCRSGLRVGFINW